MQECHEQLTKNSSAQLVIVRQELSVPYLTSCGPGSSVSIGTGYRLDGPGSNPGVVENFRTCPDRHWGPASLLYNRYHVYPRVKSSRGVTLNPHSFYSRGQERVELYLYSPYGRSACTRVHFNFTFYFISCEMKVGLINLKH